MTEQTEATGGSGYYEAFIGECGDGRCACPAPVRVFEDFALGALHHVRYEATFGLDLLEGWHSAAELHRNSYLIRMFSVASEELRDLKAEAERRISRIDRADHGFESNEEIRLGISEGE
jgi:hypothetical protein